MKKRMVALLTLAIFLVGIFGSNVAVMATQAGPANGATATVVNVPVKNPAGGAVYDPNMMDLQLKTTNPANSRTAYCFNATKEMPSEDGTTGYTLASDQGESGYLKLAAKPRTEFDTLRNHVRNVVWNGYPYLAGSWKGVVGDPAGYEKKYEMTNKARLTELYNMQVTQQAIWFYTDSKVTTGPLAPDISKLVAAAKLNPAPANFKLDLYNSNAPKFQNVVALVQPASSKNDVVKVKVESEWLDENGVSAYTGERARVSYEIYEGNSATKDKLLATYEADRNGNATIPLINDEGTYTIREVFVKDAESFKVRQNDQVVNLKQVPPSQVTFKNVFTGIEPGGDDPIASVTLPVGAEVTLDDRRPNDGTFTAVLKDSAGNTVESKTNSGKVITFSPLSFDQEGTYTYTLTEVAGSNQDIKYDPASYELTVTVTKELTPIEKKPILKVQSSWKKNGATYDRLVPAFENTTIKHETTSLTVNKVWKNDKINSRPQYVNVQLYRNGTAYGDLVRLDANNHWSYTWKDLDVAYKWSVNEPTVPTGYTKTVKTNSTTWTITNTAKAAGITVPNTTKPTTKPVITKPNTMRVDRGTPQTDDTSHLNWWVTGATISLGGMCLIALLWILSRRKQQGKK